jgi:hypothetical protein
VNNCYTCMCTVTKAICCDFGLTYSQDDDGCQLAQNFRKPAFRNVIHSWQTAAQGRRLNGRGAISLTVSVGSFVRCLRAFVRYFVLLARLFFDCESK